MSSTFNAGEHGIFAQPDGPGTIMRYLGNHGVETVEQDLGSVNRKFKPDPKRQGRFISNGTFRDEPGTADFTISFARREDADYVHQLVRRQCPTTIYIGKDSCGKRGVFANYNHYIVLPNAQATKLNIEALAARVPGENEETMTMVDFSGTDIKEIFNLNVERQSTSEAAALNAIAFGSDLACPSASCGDFVDFCEKGFVAGKAESGSPSDTAAGLLTTNEGGTWTAWAADPFAAAEDIASVVAVTIDNDTTRYIVARGTADNSNPMEVAYTDDDGATWTNVDVGSTNNQYAVGPRALFALDKRNIWLVTTGGYIYFSDDAGATWTAQESGGTTTSNLHGIHGSDENNLFAVGASDTVLKTTDGGTSWTSATSPGNSNTVRAVQALNKNFVFVGDAGGYLYRSTDGGTTWSTVTYDNSATGKVRDLAFVNDHVGFMLHNSTSPVGTIYRTINGGYDWKAYTTPTNNGLNALYACHENLAYAVGGVQDGTAVILKAAYTVSGN